MTHPTALPNEIPNHLLTTAMVPGYDATWNEIVPFARSFDGYKHWGSFERCGEIANAKRMETLVELRTCLFFEQRRWNHYGRPPDHEAMQSIRELLALIRAKIAADHSSRM
jgi:hypothetical protein